MDCCNANEKCLIVTAINPIWCSHPVHQGTFFNVLIDKFCSCKCREIIIFAHIYSKKTKHKYEATCCLQIQLSIFFLSLGLDTSFFLQSILTLIVQTIESAV